MSHTANMSKFQKFLKYSYLLIYLMHYSMQCDIQAMRKINKSRLSERREKVAGTSRKSSIINNNSSLYINEFICILCTSRKYAARDRPLR